MNTCQVWIQEDKNGIIVQTYKEENKNAQFSLWMPPTMNDRILIDHTYSEAQQLISAFCANILKEQAGNYE